MKTELEILIETLYKKNNSSYNKIIKMAKDYLGHEADIYIDTKDLECLLDPEKCEPIDTDLDIELKAT